MSLMHTTLGSNDSHSDRILRLHGLLKCLAQCNVVLGLIIFILAALADYMSSRIHTIRMIGLEECCSFYFILTGIIGICGSASHRRSLILAFMAKCFGECDWHLLATSLPENSRCQILCGENIDDNKRSLMTRLGTEYRLDAGIIAATILQMGLSLFSASVCCREICMECRPAVWNIDNQQLDMMVPLNLRDGTRN
ncbi:unnamed protein product [Litomosoides sigmodontis]|uniref:Uncharacterized protein n=1 Tax=Litomosoides sigmodontis TaxID=42156 RepID=A0A3P7JSD1_LITSI|nr:unnamed protein product [Litomosoides sigmodontis]